MNGYVNAEGPKTGLKCEIGGCMEIVMRKVGELVPYERNPRRNDMAVDTIVASIERFGFRNPIIITPDDVIVSGHTRRKAAMKIGLEEVPCIVVDRLTEEKVRMFRLADNKTAELSSWDMDLLKTELLELEGVLDMSLFGFEGDKPKPEPETQSESRSIICPRCRAVLSEQ